MPGFRYCQWCDGKGCIACDAEQKKWTEKALASAPKWRDGDIRDVRDATVKEEMLRRMKGLDYMTEDQVEKAFKPALDAEYARQFPGGPKPIFTMKRNNPDDMALLKSFAGREALEETFKDGGSRESSLLMLVKAEVARLTQATRQTLCPNESDRDSTSQD